MYLHIVLKRKTSSPSTRTPRRSGYNRFFMEQYHSLRLIMCDTRGPPGSHSFDVIRHPDMRGKTTYMKQQRAIAQPTDEVWAHPMLTLAEINATLRGLRHASRPYVQTRHGHTAKRERKEPPTRTPRIISAI